MKFRATGITQKSAWFVNHRIRLALGMGPEEQQLSGEIEVDETFIGGKARNMHIEKRKRRITGTGGKDKPPSWGFSVRTTVVTSTKKKALQAEVKRHVEAGSALYTDSLLSYQGLASDYAHQVIDHAVQCVDGKIHTNGLENFWSLLKRGISGTYISVEPFHLFRYLDEQAYWFNHRDLTDGERFGIAVSGIVGKRVTYDQLTGNEDKNPQKSSKRQGRGQRNKR